MTTLQNSFQGGANGATISAANSGGASGNAFDAVAIGASCTLTFSNTQSVHGGLAASSTTPVSASNSIVEWTTSLTGSTVPQIWFRIYAYLPSLPPNQLHIASVRNGGTYCGGVAVASNGKVVTLNASSGTQTTSTTVLAAGKWFRLEGYVIGSATAGQIQVKIFASNPDSAIPDETNTSGSAVNTNSALNRVESFKATRSPNWKQGHERRRHDHPSRAATGCRHHHRGRAAGRVRHHHPGFLTGLPAPG